MAYFNHAFTKVFLGTQVSGIGSGQNPNPNLVDGFIVTAGVPTLSLGTISATSALNYGPGSYGFFDPKTNLSVDGTFVSSSTCCPLYLASAALVANDKIGPYHGGYKESNKSKLINPKFIHRFYRVDPCTPQQSVISIGVTPGSTAALTPNCDFEFLCGESYHLRLDMKGSPALRFMNHNAYQTLSAYTGCCAGPIPTPVDSTLVMIDWATQITTNPYLMSFVVPVIYDEAGIAWYAPGTTVTLDGTNTPVLPAQWWTAYVSPGHTLGATAGIRLFGAYVDTKFGNCSFQLSDFFEKEPIKLYASLTDLNGDPCTFEGLCVYNDCLGVQGGGFGETVVRDLILSEKYLQNHFHSDIRMREIEQGDQVLASINRNALYTRYYILHTVPRYNNPSGVFDNDQYMLEIISTGTNASLEKFMDTWLTTCAGCVSLEENTCTACVITAD